MVLGVALITGGCETGPCNCNQDKDETRAEFGSPEDTDVYYSDNYYSATWWYWSDGIS